MSALCVLFMIKGDNSKLVTNEVTIEVDVKKKLEWIFFGYKPLQNFITNC